MLRDSQIPLFLWLATAVLLHLTWAGGTDRVVSVLEERLRLREFAVSVRKHVRAKHQTFEVSLLEGEAPTVEEEQDGQAAPPDDGEPETSDTPEEPDALTDQALPRVAENKPAPDKPKPADEVTPRPLPKAPEPEAEPKPRLELLPEPAPPPEQRVEIVPQDQKRVAVEQDVENKMQKDNPDAKFMADEANRVAEETQARITNTEKHQTNTPNVSGARTGPESEPGNSEQTRIAQLEDAPGEHNVAPDQNHGERGKEAVGVAPGRQGIGRDSQATSEAARQARAAVSGRASQEAIAESPDALRGRGGTVSMNDPRNAQDARRGRRAESGLPESKRSKNPADLFGLGAQGTTENGINLNLSQQAALDTIGPREIDRARRRDAERRRSEHRGTMRFGGLERWKSAIENYIPSVKLGNQTALNTARVPFARYLNLVHNRIHPIFADEFLGSLDALPANHPLRQPDLSTWLEIAVSQSEGRLVKMGVVKSSGLTAFDVGALESVNRAAPFGPAPVEIMSPDGNVYLHWEFHQYPYACGTFNARPFILKGAPAPPPAPPPKQFDDQHPADAPKKYGWMGEQETFPAGHLLRLGWLIPDEVGGFSPHFPATFTGAYPCEHAPRPWGEPI